jgi:CO/xanthine dehydrogenase FAD-binding subunit
VLKSLAAAGDGAKVIAGGQSLAPMLNVRLARTGRLIDINGVGELGEIAAHYWRAVSPRYAGA